MKKLDNEEKDGIVTMVVIVIFILTIINIDRTPLLKVNSVPEEDYKYEIDSLKEVDSKTYYEFKKGKKIKVTATVYNPVKSQTDDSPLITADNSKINLEKLNSGELKWIAVSRDLLSYVDYGSKVHIRSKKDPKINGVYIVKDRLNSRFTKRIDILKPINENLGKWDDVELEIIGVD